MISETNIQNWMGIEEEVDSMKSIFDNGDLNKAIIDSGVRS